MSKRLLDIETRHLELEKLALKYWPVYYVSKRLLDVETRYLELEKLALALMVASRKLSSYIHAHSIEVLTNYPLRQVLQKSEAASRLLKWAIKLGSLK